MEKVEDKTGVGCMNGTRPPTLLPSWGEFRRLFGLGAHSAEQLTVGAVGHAQTVQSQTLGRQRSESSFGSDGGAIVLQLDQVGVAEWLVLLVEIHVLVRALDVGLERKRGAPHTTVVERARLRLRADRVAAADDLV